MLRTTEILAVASVVVMGLVLGMAGVASAEAVLWLKADTLGLSDGAVVNSWADSSSFGNDVTKTLGTPTYKTGVIGGKPVVRFDGASQMQAPDADSLDAESYTVFTVNTFGVTTNTQIVIAKGDPAAGAPAQWEYVVYGRDIAGAKLYENNTRNDDGAGGGESGSIWARGGNDWGTDTFNIGTGWFDNTLLPDNYSSSDPPCVQAYLNGAPDTPYQSHYAVTNPTLVATNTHDLIIGRQGIGDPRGLIGDIAEIALLDFAASPQQILDVNAYLGAKYGIAVAAGGNAAAGEALLIPEPACLTLLLIGLPFVMRRKRR